MRNILKGRLTLAVLFSLLLLVSGTSAVVYANGEPQPPIIDSGKEAATEQHFHLSTDNVLRLDINGPVDGYNSITGNLMTFTHPGTPNSAAITQFSYENLVEPKGPKRISGAFTIGVGWPTFPPGFIYGPVNGEIFVVFDAQSIFVPKIDEQWEPDHYNFEGTFKIIGGTDFYEGIQGVGNIGGTFHNHDWSDSTPPDPDKPWFDFVMIGRAQFPGR